MEKIEPCIRCGTCCKGAVCTPGVKVYKTEATPCPGLKFDGEIYSCELMEIVSEVQKPFFFFLMGVGFGCTNEERLESLKKSG